MSNSAKNSTRVSQYNVTQQPKKSTNLENGGVLSTTDESSKQGQRVSHPSSCCDDFSKWLCCLCLWHNRNPNSAGFNCCGCCEDNDSTCCDNDGCGCIDC